MANDTDVSALAQYRVRDIEKNGAKVQVVTLDLGGSGAESLVAGTLPVSGSVSTSSAAYALRYDEGATYTYIGEAAAGSAESSAVWRIKRLTNASNAIVWADGNTGFDNVWDDRASLSFS